MGDEAAGVFVPVKGAENQYIVIAERLKQMDAMAIDMEVLSINPFWYRKDRDTAAADRQAAEREARRAVRRAAASASPPLLRSPSSSPTSRCNSSRTP